MKKQPCIKPQFGMSLLELMIAMLIGAFLIGGVLQIFLSSKQTYRVQEGLARMQENGRFALEFIAREVRMAGFTGCNTKNTTLANTLNNNTSSWEINFGLPVQGFDDVAADFSTFSDVIVGTDVITLLRADPNAACTIDHHVPTAASIHCAANHQFKQSEILVVSNCVHSAVFQMSNVNNNNTISVVAHNTGNATNPGNCTKGLGLPVPDPCTTNGTPYNFEDGKIRRMLASGFYIKTGAGGQPALHSESLNTPAQINAGNVRTVAEELVEGIEDMQVLYGADGDGDGAADYFVPAETAGLDMNQVVSVRVSLLARTVDDNLTDAAVPYVYNGATTTPTDRRIRRVFTSTFAVRNRLD